MSKQFISDANINVIVQPNNQQNPYSTQQTSKITPLYPSASHDTHDELIHALPIERNRSSPKQSPTDFKSQLLDNFDNYIVTIDTGLCAEVMDSRTQHRVFSELDGRPDLLVWSYKHEEDIYGPYTGAEMDEMFANRNLDQCVLIKRLVDQKYCNLAQFVKQYVRAYILSNKAKYGYLIHSPPHSNAKRSSFDAMDDSRSKPLQKPGRRDSRIVSEPVRPSLFFLDGIEPAQDTDCDDKPQPTRTRSRPVTL